MLKQKRKKTSRARGSNSHFWGHKKKHRGKGHRGGFGLAGTGARGDQQKPGIMGKSRRMMKKVAAVRGITLEKAMEKKHYFGKHGFKSIHQNLKRDTLSLRYIEINFDKLVETGIITKDKNEFVLDTTKAYDKVIGRGTFTKKITLICKDISANAKALIEKAGGKVEVTSGKTFDESSEDEE